MYVCTLTKLTNPVLLQPYIYLDSFTTIVTIHILSKLTLTEPQSPLSPAFS